MNITLLCSDTSHPVNPYLMNWIENSKSKHSINLIRRKSDATGGDILFLISCHELVTVQDRDKYDACLVIHASDLPMGRGWSPHIWEIERGAEFITVCILNAEDQVDSGSIWKKVKISIPRHSLADEINHLLFTTEIELMNYVIDNYHNINPVAQSEEITPTYYSKRDLRNSELDPSKSIVDQFNLLRVCDQNRYPAYFDHLGYRYVLKLEKHNVQ